MLSVKLDVLDTCISTSITYACETWGSNVSEAKLCLSVKLDVLDTCISTSITYACETWGSNVNEAELCLSVKLDVLDTCISTSITYACETWGSNVNEAELSYRSGIKVAMNVRENTNNEIIYIESGKYPIECKVKKAEMNFWLYVIEYS